MKMLIEKQAAAAACLHSPSRLEAFAADSPPRRRRRGRPGTPTKSSGGSGVDSCGSRTGGRDAFSSPLTPRRTASAGGIALSELVSATTPPRKRPLAMKIDVGGDMGGAEQRQSLAQETYTKTFTGMQVLTDCSGGWPWVCQSGRGMEGSGLCGGRSCRCQCKFRYFWLLVG